MGLGSSIMKIYLLLVIFTSLVHKEILANPEPENDVHFHVNMPGARKSYPLKDKGNKGKEAGKDYADDDDEGPGGWDEGDSNGSWEHMKKKPSTSSLPPRRPSRWGGTGWGRMRKRPKPSEGDQKDGKKGQDYRLNIKGNVIRSSITGQGTITGKIIDSDIDPRFQIS